MPEVLSLALASSSADLQVPASITTRPMQSTLTFQSYTKPGSKQQSVALQVSLGTHTAQTSVTIVPSQSPVLTVPEKQLAKPGTASAFPVSALDASGAAVVLSASNLPRGASFDHASDPASGNFRWIPEQSQLGDYTITFTAVNSLNLSSTATVRLAVGSGRPVATTLAGGASQSAKLACSPGGVASLLGSWLVPDNSVWPDPTDNTASQGRASVTVNGDYVPVLYTSGTRVDFLCPQVSPGTPLQVLLETNSSKMNPMDATMLEAAPGIFTIDRSGQGQGVILFQGTSAIAMPRNPFIFGEPAQPGDTLAIRVTGLSPDALVSVNLGNVNVAVQSIQPVDGSPGVSEVLMTVPTGIPFGDAVPVRLQVIEAGGQAVESNVAKMAVEAVRP